jgi:hypothetical protein
MLKEYKGKEQAEVVFPLAGERRTRVFHEKESSFNAPHHFVVAAEVLDAPQVLQEVHFQEGALNVEGLNGVMNEDLLLMVIKRLQSFQDSDFRCRENALALTHLEEALMWLTKRTADRQARNVEGTHEV